MERGGQVLRRCPHDDKEEGGSGTDGRDPNGRPRCGLYCDCLPPMCQMNLEAFQEPISKSQGKELGISIVYLPQLMGLAFGLSVDQLNLNLNLALTGDFKSKAGI